MEMSIRDIEPVKSFIAAIVDVQKAMEPSEHRMAINKALISLYGGFGHYSDVKANELKAHRGWKIASADVPKIEREKWPSVAIVIPVFNSPELLKRCLISLMKTYYPGDVQYIAVDNASTDPETLAILANQPFTPVRFDEPVGFAQAVNAGMKACPNVDYYVLFNQDCEVLDGHDDWLTALVNWMEVRSQCAVAGAKLLYPNGLIQHAGMDIPKGSCCRHRLLNAQADEPAAADYEKMAAVTGAVYAIRASVLDEVGYLDEGYKLGCEDVEFCLRVAAMAGKEVWYVPDSVVRHHDNGVRKTNPQDSVRIKVWAYLSDKKFRSEWGDYIDLVSDGSIAIVLPDYNPVAGGCRVAAALANTFINCGMETTIYVDKESSDGLTFAPDVDFPQLFQIKPLSELERCDILIATRFDTVKKTKHILANKKYYLVQQIETCMAKYCGASEDDVIRSYAQQDYEIITIGEHLAEKLAEFGKTSTVLDVGFYRELYSGYNRRAQWQRESGEPFKVLMYACGADYKGSDDLPAIAKAIRDKLGDKVEINSFHRDMPKPDWADKHFRPQSTSDVAEVYAAHDVYVYASHSDGFAMTPIEAMACGTPVIMTDFPGKDQYAVDGVNCLIVLFRDFEGIANAIAELREYPSGASILVGQGYCTALYYDWSKIGKQYVRKVLGAPV